MVTTWLGGTLSGASQATGSLVSTRAVCEVLLTAGAELADQHRRASQEEQHRDGEQGPLPRSRGNRHGKHWHCRSKQRIHPGLRPRPRGRFIGHGSRLPRRPPRGRRQNGICVCGSARVSARGATRLCRADWRRRRCPVGRLGEGPERNDAAMRQRAFRHGAVKAIGGRRRRGRQRIRCAVPTRWRAPFADDRSRER